MTVWRESVRVRLRGLVHRTLITTNEDLDARTLFVICQSWTNIHEDEVTEDPATCLECVPFIIGPGDGLIRWPGP